MSDDEGTGEKQKNDKRRTSDDEGEPREMVTGGGSQMMRDSVEGRGC
jgi:hypothetical protein